MSLPNLGAEASSSIPGHDRPSTARGSDRLRRIGRFGLAAVLIGAGCGHLTWARKSFLGQVPAWVPLDGDSVVVLSGIVEIALGAALLSVRTRRSQLGVLVAGFFVAVFPGNVSQLLTHTDAFGLTSDTRRVVRLLFQPLLVAWSVWSTREPG
jgi:uncharacterized membrane protein